MKFLIVTILLAVALWGVVNHRFPQIGLRFPFVGTISAALDDTGLSTSPGKLVDAGKDLRDAAQTHQFGGWHLAVIVIAVLSARKLLLLLIR